MKKLILLVFALLLWGTQAWAVPLTGTLTNLDGLFATQDWDSDTSITSSITWTVTYDAATGWYTYQYNWYGVRKDLSHIIFELSDSFEVDNFKDGTTSYNPDDLKTYEVDDSSNPGFPAELYGIKFEPTSNVTAYTVIIVTDRDPVWGNFYAVDGKTPGREVYAYNTGFADPNGAFIVVPDSTSNGGGTGEPIPEPGTIVLVGAGVVGLALLRRKQK